MRTLTRAVKRSDIGGEPLPAVFDTFGKNKIIIRRSEVSMIAGQPGSGKSTLALALALRMQVPTLYICADTNAHTMAMRLLSMITGKSQDESEMLLQNPEQVRPELAKAGHLFWSFESAPSLDDLDEEVQAFEEVWGIPPELIVLDNLSDLSSDGGEEWSGLRAAIKEIKFLARETNAALLVLHHTSEAFTNGPCPPRAALQGKVAQLPALILTINSDDNYLSVAPVKNRYGKADPSGFHYVRLQWNPAHMYVNDIKEPHGLQAV